MSVNAIQINIASLYINIHTASCKYNTYQYCIIIYTYLQSPLNAIVITSGVIGIYILISNLPGFIVYE